jgi:hypothetical protein
LEENSTVSLLGEAKEGFSWTWEAAVWMSGSAAWLRKLAAANAEISLMLADPFIKIIGFIIGKLE